MLCGKSSGSSTTGPTRRTGASGSWRIFARYLLVLIVLSACAGCCSAGAPTRIRARRPRPAALHEHRLKIVEVEPGVWGYVYWPIEEVEWNAAETRRELEELRAAPFWED